MDPPAVGPTSGGSFSLDGAGLVVWQHHGTGLHVHLGSHPGSPTARSWDQP